MNEQTHVLWCLEDVWCCSVGSRPMFLAIPKKKPDLAEHTSLKQNMLFLDFAAHGGKHPVRMATCGSQARGEPFSRNEATAVEV